MRRGTLSQSAAWFPRGVRLFVLMVCPVLFLAGAEPATVSFDVPAGEAGPALLRFAQQARREIMFPAKSLRGITTNALRGAFTVREGLERLLAGTSLSVIEDSSTGGLVVRRKEPEAQDARQSDTTDPPQKKMKSNNPLTVIATWLTLGLASASNAAEADRNAGAIAGRVSNQATGVYLEGARVQLLPAGTTTLTTRDGHYELTRVPPGDHSLVVSYTGLDSQTVSVTVAAGRTAVQDVLLTSGIYLLDKFVVPGEREGNAKAITLQRNAPNVKNVIAGDAFGIISDENIGNFLQRLPGITLEEQEEVKLFVRIRGVDPSLNAVTVDGTRQPGGGTRGGLGRSFEMDTVPAEFIETIEVTKAPTPDMDADSIGGSVNLKTKSALDRKGRMATYRLGASYTPNGNKVGPIGSFMYSDQLGRERRWGIMINGSYEYTERSRDQSLINAWEATTAMDRPVFFVLGNDGPDDFEYTRYGLGMRLDYRVSKDLSVYGSAMYSYNGNDFQRLQANFASGLQQRVAVTVVNGVGRDASNQVAHILPGFTGPPGGGLVTETVGQTFQYNQLVRDRYKKTWTYQLGGRKLIEDGEIDFNANLALADGWEGRWTAAPTVTGVGFRFDRTNPLGNHVADWRQISGRDIRDPANFTFNSFSRNRSILDDRIVGFQANLRKSFRTVAPSYIKSGVRYRKQDPNQFLDNYPYTYRGTSLAKYHAEGPTSKMNPDLRFLNIAGFVKELETNPENFVENKATRLQNQLNNDKQASESVGAAYIMGGLQLGRLGILGGVRVEETRVEGSGNVTELTPEERARRAAWVGAVTEEENLRRIRAERGNFRHADAEYRNVFPGLHFRYEAFPGALARLSYSTGIGRPNFNTIIPSDSVNHETQLVVANNTALKPQRADNFDLSLEYYYEPAGQIAVSFFLKEISDFIYTGDVGFIESGTDNGFGGDYAGYLLRTQANGGFARIRGVELSVQHRFAHLPGFLSRFSAFANYTRLQTMGNFGTNQTISGLQIDGFIPESGSVGVSYNDHRWGIRVFTTYTGSSLVSTVADPSVARYNKSRNPTDLSITYMFDPKLSVFLNVNNVFNSRQGGTWQFARVRDRHTINAEPNIKLGLTGRF
jgi:iron complex outermembrane receptor protein